MGNRRSIVRTALGIVCALALLTTAPAASPLHPTTGSVRFLRATALLPSPTAGLKGAAVSQRVDGDELRVDVERDRLTWRRGPDGYECRGVTTRQ